MWDLPARKIGASMPDSSILRHWWEAGYQPLYCMPRDGGRHTPQPRTTDSAPWPAVMPQPPAGAAYRPAIRYPNGVVAIDIDCDRPEDPAKRGWTTYERMASTLGPLPATHRLTARGPFQRSGHYLFRVPVGTVFNNNPRAIVDAGGCIDLLWRGYRFSWAPGDIHAKTGQPVVCYDPAGVPLPGHQMPAVELLPELPVAWLAVLIEQQPRELSTGPSPAVEKVRAVAAVEWDRAITDLDALLAAGVRGQWEYSSMLDAAWHLAKLSPEHAVEAWDAAFDRAGVDQDPADRVHITSAVERAVPDEIVEVDSLFANAPTKARGAVEQSAPIPEVPQVPADWLESQLLSGAAITAVSQPQWLIEGFVVANSFCRLYSPPKSGKSFVALDMAACVALGIPWHGRKVRQGKVLYVAAEGQHGMRSMRVPAWEAQHGLDLTGSGMFDLLPVPIQWSRADHTAALLALIQKMGYVLVVVDTLARTIVGVNEDNNTEMGVINSAIDMMVQETEATIQLIAHTGHNGDRARGASAVFGAVDTDIFVTKDRAAVTVLVKEHKDFDSEDIKEDLTLVGVAGVDSCALVDGAPVVNPLDAEMPDPNTPPDIGIELLAYEGTLGYAVQALAGYMATAAVAGAGRSRVEALRTNGRRHDDQTWRKAWDVLLWNGAIEKLSGSTSGTGKHLWVPTDGPREAVAEVNRARPVH